MLLIYLLYSLFCTVVPCIIFRIIVIHTKKIYANFNIIEKNVYVYLFLLYITLVYMVTGIGTIYDIGRYETIIRLNEINIIPFANGSIFSYILNIIMFIPFGFLVSLIWPYYNSLKKILITSFTFSVMIEVSQLFNRRYTDINDLFMNVIGAIIGWLLYYIINKYIIKNKNDIAKKNNFVINHELIFYLICSFLGYFFFFNSYIF